MFSRSTQMRVNLSLGVFCKTAAKFKDLLHIFLNHPVQDSQFMFVRHAICDAVHITGDKHIVFSQVGTVKAEPFLPVVVRVSLRCLYISRRPLSMSKVAVWPASSMSFKPGQKLSTVFWHNYTSTNVSCILVRGAVPPVRYTQRVTNF